MRTMHLRFTIGVLVGLCLVAPAWACTASHLLFSDTFDSENNGAGALNYTGLSQWNVVLGSVDLTGNGFHDVWPHRGLYLDLAGSTGWITYLQSKSTLLVQQGQTYRFSFDLAGSQSDTGFNLAVALVTSPAPPVLLFDFIILGRHQDFTHFSRTFTVAADTPAHLAFLHLGSGTQGLLLDNVNFALVPWPSSLALMAVSLAGLGLIRFRNRLRG